MANKLHRDLTIADGIHIVHAFEYANATARLAAGGFVAADIGKVAQQQDNNSYWVLATTAPLWTEITATSIRNQFVFQPGGTASPGVYTTWASLYTAHQATPGRKVIVFDTSFVTPAVVPAGTYNMVNTVWRGRAVLRTAVTSVELVDGVLINNLEEMTEGLLVTSTSTSDVLRWTAGNSTLRLTRSSQLSRTGTAAAINMANLGAQFWLRMDRRSSIPQISSEVITVPGGKILVIDMLDACTIGNNSFSGAGFAAVLRDASCVYGATQANFTGIFFDIFADIATNMGYTAAVLANWNNVAPGTVKVALDRIAAAVGPIP